MSFMPSPGTRVCMSDGRLATVIKVTPDGSDDRVRYEDGTERVVDQMHDIKEVLDRAGHRVNDFIVQRLASLLSRPEMFGSKVSVELQVLQLLEIRRVLLVPELGKSALMRSYTDFIARELDNATNQPLAYQLESRGRTAEFEEMLGKFVQAELELHRNARDLDL